MQLSDHYDYRKLLRFTMPTVLMMLSVSVYVMVDGLFVSNCVGKQAFAAVNLIWPFPMLIGAMGYMFGTGGSALVAKTLGEGNLDRARKLFCMNVLAATFMGGLLSLIGSRYIEDMSRLLGATEGQMLNDCITYGQLIMWAMPFYVVQTMFQPFMIAAEKPGWGLIINFVAGFANFILDIVLIVIFKMGVEGAGWATLISQAIGAILPIFFFGFMKPSNLYFSSPVVDLKALWKVCTNGSSEFIVNASLPLVNLLYVLSLWRDFGEDGVGAYGVIMYVNVIFFSVYTGFSMGSAPIVSYNYGAQNMSEVQNVRKKIFRILLVSSVMVTVCAEALSPLLSWAFSHGDAGFKTVILEAFCLYALSFLIAPFNIYASSFFTALNNGKVSAMISFSRILFFQIGAMLLLPIWLGIHGFWIALPVAELLCLVVTVYYYKTLKSIYNY